MRYKYRLLQRVTEPFSTEVNTPQASGRPVTGVILAISCKRQGIVAWRKLEATSDSCGRVSNVKPFAKADVSSTAA